MPRTLQFRRLSANTLANTTGADGELIINTTNKTLTVHDGALPGGYALLNSQTDNNIDQVARNTANSATTLAQSAYNYANTIVSDTQIDPVARSTANTAANNIVILQGVNLTQNTNITNATNLAQAAFDYANTIVSDTQIDQYARDTANTASNNIVILQGVNTTQNTNITNATNLAQGAYDTANTKLNLTGGTITGNLVVSGKSTFSGVAELFSGLVDATGVVVHDCSTGRIFNHTSIDNNFTANFTNLNLNSGEATTLTLVLNQGGTAYIANSVQIGGIAQTIRWSANTVPTGNVNAVDVQSFSILNSSGTYTVLGQLSTFG